MINKIQFNDVLLFSVLENPPSGKQMVSKMLVIKKVSKEDASTAFSAGFATTGTLPTNGNKAPTAGSSVYKNLVPKPAVAPIKVRLVNRRKYFYACESLFYVLWHWAYFKNNCGSIFFLCFYTRWQCCKLLVAIWLDSKHSSVNF